MRALYLAHQVIDHCANRFRLALGDMANVVVRGISIVLHDTATQVRESLLFGCVPGNYETSLLWVAIQHSGNESVSGFFAGVLRSFPESVFQNLRGLIYRNVKRPRPFKHRLAPRSD